MNRIKIPPPQVFFRPFFHLSYLCSLLFGFGLAAHLSVVLSKGSGGSLFLKDLMEMHGHFQLGGWLGVLLIGVSLHVFPRMIGAKVIKSAAQFGVFLIILISFILEAISFLLLYLGFDPRLCKGLAASFYFVAIVSWMAMLLPRAFRMPPDRADLGRMAPWLIGMFTGSLAYAAGRVVVNVFGIEIVGSINIHAFGTESFIRLVLVCSVLGFGIKMLPAFTRARGSRLFMKQNALIYLISAIGLLVLSHSQISNSSLITGALKCAIGVTLAWYVMALLFSHLKKRSTVSELNPARADADRFRKNFADKGEFGRWELFVYAGMLWLLIAAAGELISGFQQLSRKTEMFPFVTIRHAYLLGFSANMIMGMAYRLMPGLMSSPLQSPSLVGIVFTIFNIGVIARMVPTLGASCGADLDYGGMLVFGSSGPICLLALTFQYLHLCLMSPNKLSSSLGSKDRLFQISGRTKLPGATNA